MTIDIALQEISNEGIATLSYHTILNYTSEDVTGAKLAFVVMSGQTPVGVVISGTKGEILRLLLSEAINAGMIDFGGGWDDIPETMNAGARMLFSMAVKGESDDSFIPKLEDLQGIVVKGLFFRALIGTKWDPNKPMGTMMLMGKQENVSFPPATDRLQVILYNMRETSVEAMVASTSYSTILNYTDDSVIGASLGLIFNVGTSDSPMLLQATISGPKGMIMQLFVAEARRIVSDRALMEGATYEVIRNYGFWDGYFPTTLNAEARSSLSEAILGEADPNYTPTLAGLASLISTGQATRRLLDDALAKVVPGAEVAYGSVALYGLESNVSFPSTSQQIGPIPGPGGGGGGGGIMDVSDADKKAAIWPWVLAAGAVGAGAFFIARRPVERSIKRYI